MSPAGMSEFVNSEIITKDTNSMVTSNRHSRVHLHAAMSHKHSKILTSQLPLAAANKKRMMDTMQHMERIQNME